MFGMKKRKPVCFIVMLLVFFLVAGAFGYYYYNNEVKNGINRPVIEFDDDYKTVISVKSTEQDLLKNVKATDAEDGDISNEVIVEQMSNLIDGNRREVVYVVCDSDNNVTKVTKEITYSDYTSPVIEAIEGNTVIKERKYSDILSCFKATDVIDGDISDKIKIDSIDTSKDSISRGVFPLVLSVTNSCGDVSYLETSVTLIQ